MDRTKILKEAKDELEKGRFIEGDMSVALRGTGVVVSGCELSKAFSRPRVCDLAIVGRRS